MVKQSISSWNHQIVIRSYVKKAKIECCRNNTVLYSRSYLDQNKTLWDIVTLYSKLTFQDDGDGAANTETTAYAAYSPLDRHIHVRSSNREISVGKYVVFHVKSNFALTYFDWIIVSKNLILKSGREYASDIHPGNFLGLFFNQNKIISKKIL